MTNLPPVPFQAKIKDPQDFLPPIWADWFKQAAVRMGGVTAFNNVELAIQDVITLSSAVATGTTVIPLDDTIPQNTEGTEFLTATVTPRAVTNRIVIEAILQLASSASGSLIAALFQDSIVGALAASTQYAATANGTGLVVLRHSMTAGTLNPITYKIRAGSEAAGTVTLNGVSGSRLFGGITISSLRVMEFSA